MKKSMTALLLTAAILLSVCGCAAGKTDDPMADVQKNPSSESTAGKTDDPGTGIQKNPVSDTTETDPDSTIIADFGVRLFQTAMKSGENTLISPLSVLCALAMTANGADAQTLSQMEAVLGMNTAGLNAFIRDYLAQLPETEKCKLRLANSVWFTDGSHFTVNQNFLRTNTDYYGADIYQRPLDMDAVRSINDWVKENTDGMIPQILNQAPENAIMYLVNALAFDAQWQSVYNEYQVNEGIFTTEDGTKRSVELMYSTESRYLEDESAAGFIKYYDSNRYAFVALLPKEGVRVEDYAAGLTGGKLMSLLENPEDVLVHAAIPKFESEYDCQLEEALKTMGMTDAFDPSNADFTGLGQCDENIFISRVLHKSFISVGEQGTRAGAATAVEMAAGAAMAPQESKTVTLDRPFVYMLIDCQTNLPFFMGTMMDV